MSKTKRIVQSFGIDDWLLSLTGLVAIAIGVLDFTGWLQLSTDQLLQMAIVGLGLLMSAVVIQAKQQETKLVDLESGLERSIGGQLDYRRLPSLKMGLSI